jgi:hypothetical protein
MMLFSKMKPFSAKINHFWYESFEDFKQEVMDFFHRSYLWKTELKSLLTLRFRIVGY